MGFNVVSVALQKQSDQEIQPHQIRMQQTSTVTIFKLMN
jgi:hypothetical protein